MDGKIAGVLRIGHRVPLHRANQTVDDVVDIHERQRKAFIADRDRQIICNVVAKGRHNAVVARAAPLAKHAGHASEVHRRAGVFAVGQ
ncbi:hypothetical protein SDC9_141409 [bioreactor metagenome]|uniref:Uncharacterized protein n=1 Tax=bioreactor metagenome TaxID=1076179 RepID=A0A645E079_9ZZZZ